MQKIKITFIAVLMAMTCGCASTKKGILIHPDHPDYSISLDRPDITENLEKGNLKIWYIAKGTRSEGLHGEIEGISLSPEKGMKIDTQMGQLVYFGPWNERSHLFSRSGWIPVDLEGIYPSWGHIQTEVSTPFASSLTAYQSSTISK